MNWSFVILPTLCCFSFLLILITGHGDKRCSEDLLNFKHNLPYLCFEEAIQSLLGSKDQSPLLTLLFIYEFIDIDNENSKVAIEYLFHLLAGMPHPPEQKRLGQHSIRLWNQEAQTLLVIH